MNNILVKSTKGVFFGVMCSAASVFLSNVFSKKSYTNVYDYFKINSSIPLIFGGLVGFSYGYTGTPLYHFLYRKRSYSN